jgi:protein SCO1/2
VCIAKTQNRDGSGFRSLSLDVRCSMFNIGRSFLFLSLLLLLAPPIFAQVPPPPNVPPQRILQKIGIDQKLGDQLPLDLTFHDESGKTVHLRDYFGKKPVVLSLVYYKCPMLCTMELNGMLAAFKVTSFNIGQEYEVVTVSFDPREGPDIAAAKKASYLKQYNRPGAENGWHFLTGDAQNIEALAHAVGFRYFYDSRTDQFAHASGIMVATPNGQLSRYFYGLEYSARDLKLGLVEASDNKIGSLTEQILLLCYHYDPMTGKYGFVIMTSLRVSGGLTLLILGGFITLMLVRERRARAAGSLVSASVPPKTP